MVTVMVMVMMIMTTAVLIAFHFKRVVCGRWVEPRSQAPNIPMLSTAATLALPSTGGTTKFSFDYGGNLGGGGEVGGIYSKTNSFTSCFQREAGLFG